MVAFSFGVVLRRNFVLRIGERTPSTANQGVATRFLTPQPPQARSIIRRAIYGQYHPTFAEFRTYVDETIDPLPTTHAESLAIGV